MKRVAMIMVLGAVTTAWQFGLSSARADLIGYWPFEEVIEVDGERITPDVSPDGGHDGVLSDTAQFTPDGRFGGAIDFGEFANQAVVRLPTFPQDDRTDAGYNKDLGPGFTAIAGRESDPEIVGSQEATISFWQRRIDADGDGILEKNGNPFEFEIVTNHSAQLRVDIATMVEAYLKKIGVKANIRTLEFQAVAAACRAPCTAHREEPDRRRRRQTAVLWHRRPPNGCSPRALGRVVGLPQPFSRDGPSRR